MTFPFLLVFLGQPDFTDKRPPQKHSRRVKNVHVHPKYKPVKSSAKKPRKEQMPRFDFALIEVNEAMYSSHKDYINFKFEPTVRPICLPSKRMWKRKFKFVEKIAKVSGYGRIEAKKIDGKHQNSWQLKEANLRIIGSNDTKCEKVMFSYTYYN